MSMPNIRGSVESGPWAVTYDGFVPADEGLREALCTLGNGYFATRGAAPESSADEVHYPGTYAAGCFNRLESHVAGRTITNESIVNLPNWLVLRFAVDDGPWFDLGSVDVLEYRQELDMRRGMLTRRVRFRDAASRTTSLSERRIVHMEHEHLAALETTIAAEDWSGRLTVRAGLDGSVENTGVARYRDLASRHLDVDHVGAVDSDTIVLSAVTNQSRIQVAQAARTRVVARGEPLEVERELHTGASTVSQDLFVDVGEGEAVTVEKVVALYTSRDHAISEPVHDAVLAMDGVGGFASLLDRHALVWGHLWRKFHVELDVDDEVLKIVRLHFFHLLQTVSPNSVDLDVGVPARGLHGEAYRGLIMWDELFAFPVLNLRLPQLTREQLAYRYHRLPAARRAAHDAGMAGAMYPWQSGSNGEEMAQVLHLNPESGRWVPDPTERQRHIGLAVAYNVWNYFEATEDARFLDEAGGEMMLEVARFFAGIATYNGQRDRYELCGLLGPDEFHTGYPDREEPGLDNNAYTNVLAAWLFQRVPDLRDSLSRERWVELTEALSLDGDELDRWEEIGRRMFVPFHADGIISQFEGYEDLEELDWEGYRERYGDIHRLDRILEAEDDTPNRYKASKQADSLMLLYLFSHTELEAVLGRLGYTLSTEQVYRTVDYYLQRTTHGSTLSAVVHAWVLNRTHREEAYEYFVRALESDVADIQGGTTPEGIHLGAMAGSADLLKRCFTGIETREGKLFLDPYWPKELGTLAFDITYHGHSLTLRVSGDHVRVESHPGEAPAIRIECRSQMVSVLPGEVVELGR